MKTKSLLVIFMGYTVFMFLMAQFILNPERSYKINIVFALLSGVLFIIFMSVFLRYKHRRK